MTVTYSAARLQNGQYLIKTLTQDRDGEWTSLQTQVLSEDQARHLAEQLIEALEQSPSFKES